MAVGIGLRGTQSHSNLKRMEVEHIAHYAIQKCMAPIFSSSHHMWVNISIYKIIFPGEVTGAKDVSARDAIFPGEVHWGTRCPMFVGDAIFPGEVHWGTRCPMFVGDAIFPGEVHWGTRCPMFVGDAIFSGEVHWGTRCQCLQGISYII